jgi:hypothetical protein
VADDCAELLLWLLTGGCCGGSIRFSYRLSGEEGACGACGAFVRVGSPNVGMCECVRA